MRLITIPTGSKIAADVPGGFRTFTFKEWFTFVVENTPGFGKGYAAIRRATKLLDRIENAGETISVEDDDYVLIESTLDDVHFNPKHARAFVPHFEAFLQAQKVIGPAP